MKRKPPLLDARPLKHRPVLQEEAALWREVTQGTQAQAVRRVEKQKIKAAIKQEKGGQEYIKKLPVSPSAAARAPAVSFDKPILTKIRRGTVPVEAVLDLHGHTRETALRLLTRFIVRAQEDGIRTVLVITGKGRGQEPGTLRTLLPGWLCESPLRECIIAYDSAGLRHGGSGAWYVRIRKRTSDDRT